MNKLSSALFLGMLLAAANSGCTDPAARQPSSVTSSIDPTTATLAEAIEDWIVLLEADDMKTAQKRWTKDAAAVETLEEWWGTLGDCHKQHNYRNWLDESTLPMGGQIDPDHPGGAKQIGDATQFKIGGHDFDHMHVDWEKTERGWRIAQVWICR